MSTHRLDQYFRGQEWHNKGLRWFMVSMACMTVALLAPLVRHDITDPFWAKALFVAQGVFLLAQLATCGRMVFCYRRARKIWQGRA